MSIDYFITQRYPALLGTYGTEPFSESDLAMLPSYAKQPLAALLGVSMAADFQLLSPASLSSQNLELAESSGSFSGQWLVFAYSGQGDFWLLHKHRNETGFYDHQAENYTLPNVTELHLKLAEWLLVADLFQQFDVLTETTPTAFTRAYTLKTAYKANFISQLNSISPGLFERLPFTNL
ncbi:MAG: hypothetical protein ACRYG7_11750 [Janthinobacterium lividum]